MLLTLADAGKRYKMDWIFRGIEQSFHKGERWAILGPNGSGKSTLMKVLSGHLSLTKGKIQFLNENGLAIHPDDVYHYISYAAPYIELIEEFTLEEALRFHARLKPLLPGITPVKVYELIELPRTRTKEIRFFSSGMKQRLKLALACCSDTPVLLLDEPSTNLDQASTQWYKNLVRQFTSDRLLIIASNDPSDLDLCDQYLQITDYKH